MNRQEQIEQVREWCRVGLEFGQMQARLGIGTKELHELIFIAGCKRPSDPYAHETHSVTDKFSARQRRIYTAEDRPYDSLFLSLKWKWRCIAIQTHEELAVENGFKGREWRGGSR
jgi:hypothetical protein